MFVMNSLKTQIQHASVRPTAPFWPNLSTIGLKPIILACIGSQTAYADDCVKQVFNRYCLGGSIDTYLEAENTPQTIALENGDTQYLLQDNKKTIVLTTHENNITTITRRETPGDWINFTAWKVKIVRLYGKGEDLSDFPRYASSRSSRLNALNAGRGHAEFAWDQQDHVIKLIWDTPDFVKLSYQLSDSETGEPENSEGL